MNNIFCIIKIILSVFITTIFLGSSYSWAQNSAPDCSTAFSTPDNLWPPNHKFAEISISGITDPDNDNIQTVVQCIMQDEPLNTTGDGNTEPDAYGIGDSSAFVRQERSGNLNGRFYHIHFTASDSAGVSCSGKVLVTVRHDKFTPAVDEGPLYHSTLFAGQCDGGGTNSDPIITSTPTTEVQANDEYLYQVLAIDPDGDVLMYHLTQSPDGMSIDSATGLVSWTPGELEAGDYEISILVEDEYGGTATQSFTLTVTVLPSNSPPVITSQPDTSVTAGNLYEYQIIATDPDGDPLQYQLIEAPTGMIIDSLTGLVSWSPEANQVGDVSVTLQVSDVNGGSDTQAFVITVMEPPSNSPPIITSQPVTSVTAGELYEYPVIANDPDGDPLQYQLLDAPSGMIINAVTGLISWAPDSDQVGDVSVTLQVSDGNGGVDMQAFVIFVEAAPR